MEAMSEIAAKDNKPDDGSTVDGRPDDCTCLSTFEELPCWPCFRDGFETPNPTGESDNE